VASIKPGALIIEQSASGAGGHYLEYAKRIASVLQEDFEVKILTSRKMSNQFRDDQIPVIPTFTYGYWDNPFNRPILKLIHGKLKKFRWQIQWRNSLNLYILTRGKKSKIFLSLIFFMFIPVFISFQVLKLLTLILKKWFLILQSKFKIEVSRLKHKMRQLNPEKGFPGRISKEKGRKFKKELSDYLRESNQRPDLIFCGTITAIELLALSKMFSNKNDSLKILVVLRREPAEENLSQQFWKLLGNSIDPKVFTLYADTYPLSKQWGDVLEYPVEVLPIPTWSHEQILNLPRETSLGLTFLGDAREEKNFNEFAGLATALTLTNENLFSQVNSHSSTRLGVQTSRNDLMNRSDQQILAINRPLDSAEYSDTVFKSKIVYVNYSPINYSCRSSGVFVEALMANKPVMVSDGSWMHFELNKLSQAFWKEKFELNSKSISMTDLHQLTSSNLIAFTANREGKLAFEVKLNTGIVLKCTSWCDLSGKGYLPIPNLNDSEHIVFIAPLDKNISLKNVVVSTFNEVDPKYLGGVVAEIGRSRIALAEFYRRAQSYSRSCYFDINSFHEFHSMNNLKKMILEDLRR
jgi:hypothetical protein